MGREWGGSREGGIERSNKTRREKGKTVLDFCREVLMEGMRQAGREVRRKRWRKGGWMEGGNEGGRNFLQAQILIVTEFCKFCISWEFILRNCTDCVLKHSIPQG